MAFPRATVRTQWESISVKGSLHLVYSRVPPGHFSFLTLPWLSIPRGQKITVHIVNCDLRTYDPLAKMRIFVMGAVPYLFIQPH